jgi:hypothetical protein
VSLGLGLGLSIRSGGAGPLPLQFVMTRGYIPGNEIDGPTNSAAHLRNDCRILTKSGAVAATDIRLVFGNFKKAGAVNEQDGLNTVTVDCGIEVSATNYRGSFNGSLTQDILATDTAKTATVPTLAILPAGTAVYFRASVAVASLGLKYPRSSKVNADSTGAVENASTSQAGATGNLTTGGGSARTLTYTPLAVVGRPASPTPAIWILGDSNSYGFGETNPSYTPDANGNYGLWARGLWSVNGHTIPWANASRGGDTIECCLPASNPRQWECVQYGTHGVIGLGTNSIAAGRTLAQMQADFLTIAAAMKARTIRGKAYALTIPPRTDSTNTTPISGYEPSQRPDQFNAWLLTQIGVTIDGVIDPNTGTYNIGAGNVSVNAGVKTAATGLWSDGSYYVAGDGTHYSAAGSAIAAAVVSGWAATLT